MVEHSNTPGQKFFVRLKKKLLDESPHRIGHKICAIHFYLLKHYPLSHTMVNPGEIIPRESDDFFAFGGKCLIELNLYLQILTDFGLI